MVRKNSIKCKFHSRNLLIYVFIFNSLGSYLYSLQIRPKTGVKLLNWNLLKSVPEPNEFQGVKAYFAMVTHGLEAPPMDIKLDFEVNICQCKKKVNTQPEFLVSGSN